MANENLANIAAIGCGYWGKNLVRNFANLGKLRCICDKNETALKAQAQLYPGVRQSCDFEEVLADKQTRAVAIADSPEAVGEVFKVGCQQEITILNLAHKIIDRVQQQRNNLASEIKLIPYGQAYAPGFEDMQRRFPDITKINQYIGWQPTRSRL